MVGEHTFLGKIKADPKPGPRADATHTAAGVGLEDWGIWNILAFHPRACYHLCELSHELTTKVGPITASSNQRDFCRNAHAACALFSDDNRFVLGNDVRLVSDEVFDRFGARIAQVRYNREHPRPRQMGTDHA